MTTPLYNQQQQTTLLQLAHASVKHGLSHGQALPVNPVDFEPRLQETGAAFVTLEKRGELRGCIGSVEAYRPLVEDVAENAWNAASRDPRFGPVTLPEYPQLHFEISILTRPVPLQFTSESDLKQQIVPDRDGLIIKAGYRRGLFLPSVWELLPDIDMFMAHLKQKAGLSANYWSGDLQVARFYSFAFSDDG